MPVENPMVKAFDQVRDSIRSRITELLHKHSEDTQQCLVPLPLGGRDHIDCRRLRASRNLAKT